MFETDTKNCQCSSQGQGGKIWPRATSQLRPGLEDYVTGLKWSSVSLLSR